MAAARASFRDAADSGRYAAPASQDGREGQSGRTGQQDLQEVKPMQPFERATVPFPFGFTSRAVELELDGGRRRPLAASTWRGGQ
jgi:hypothetical protein